MTAIIVYGGRDYRNQQRLETILDAAIGRLGLTEIVTSSMMCVGHFKCGRPASSSPSNNE